MAAPQKNDHPWEWFTDRVLPSLFVALCLALGGGMWMTYQSVVNIGHILDRQQREIEALRARISHVETSLVTKSDLLETMKRVEQQLEIMMLRAGMRPTRITE
jgi:type II secretory pathway component PulJ